jgi:anti-anti-sigma factor
MSDTDDAFIAVVHCVIKISGDIHRRNAGHLQDALLDGMIATPNRLMVDLADVNAIDPVGLDVLVRAHSRAKAAGTKLLFRHVNVELENLLEENGLVTETVDDGWSPGARSEHPSRPLRPR